MSGNSVPVLSFSLVSFLSLLLSLLTVFVTLLITLLILVASLVINNNNTLSKYSLYFLTSSFTLVPGTQISKSFNPILYFVSVLSVLLRQEPRFYSFVLEYYDRA